MEQSANSTQKAVDVAQFARHHQHLLAAVVRQNAVGIVFFHDVEQNVVPQRLRPTLVRPKVHHRQQFIVIDFRGQVDVDVASQAENVVANVTVCVAVEAQQPGTPEPDVPIVPHVAQNVGQKLGLEDNDGRVYLVQFLSYSLHASQTHDSSQSPSCQTDGEREQVLFGEDIDVASSFKPEMFQNDRKSLTETCLLR